MIGANDNMSETSTMVQFDGPYAAAIVKHAEKIQALLDGGVFDIPFGNATINFANGQVQNIHVDKRTYQREALKRAIIRTEGKTPIVP